MSIILMLNLKGGVAKTTNCVALAEALADTGKRVCVIDADHQCTASELLLGEKRSLQADSRKRTLHDLLARMLDDEFEKDDIDAYVIREGVSNIDGGLENLSVIPCSVRIDDFQTNMARAKRGFRTPDEFQNAWSRRRTAVRSFLNINFDYTIVDCPPSIALQVKQFLRFGDAFIIPSVPDALSVRGSLWLMNRIDTMGYRRIKPLGTLWSLVRGGVATHAHVIESTNAKKHPYKHLPKPFETYIPNAAAIAASSEPKRAFGTFVEKYQSQFARRYRDLGDEVEERAQQLS